MIDVADLGAKYGQVRNVQKQLNMQALEAAVAIGGEVRISGVLMISEPIECLQGLSGSLHLVGESRDGSSIYYQTTVSIPYLVDLSGSANLRISNLTIDGRYAAQVGLYVGPPGGKFPGGNHYLENVRVIHCTHISYLVYGAQGSGHTNCCFQRSPIGAMITGPPPVMDNVTTPGLNPANWDADWHYTAFNYFRTCVFGDANLTSRCGLMFCAGSAQLDSCMIQAKEDDSEAFIICDGTGITSDWRGLYFDSGLAPIAIKFGYYAPYEHLTASRVHLHCSHLSINDVGEHWIDAKNVRNSNFGPLSVAGPLGSDFRFEDVTCFNNVFTNCRHLDGAEVKIDH